MHHARIRNRLNRVANHVRWSETPEMGLDRMAALAGMSKFHFARVFKEMFLEAPVEYLLRIRLEQAAQRMIQAPSVSLTDVAMTSGYASSQSFSNAFRHRYGLSPRSFRARNTSFAHDFPANQYFQTKQARDFLRLSQQVTPRWQPKVITLPDQHVAYIRTRGAYYDMSGSTSDGPFKMKTWAKAKGIWQDNQEFVGICPDNSAITPARLCEYDLGLSVPTDIAEDEVVSIQNLPGGQFATIYVTGCSVVAKAAWRWLISSWLPQSGFSLRQGCYFEGPLYRAADNTFLGAHMYMPVCKAI